MDLAVFHHIHHGWKSGFCDGVFAILSYSGLGQVGILIAALLGLKKPARPYVFPIVLSIILTGTLLAQALKSAVPRDRPSNLPATMPMEPHKRSSFPSGHTTTAFAIATSALLVSRRPKTGSKLPNWAAAGLFIWASGVGLSRIYRGVHWPTDVLAGAAAGVFGAICLELLYQGFEGGSPRLNPQ